VSSKRGTCDSEVKALGCALRYLPRQATGSRQGPILLYALRNAEGLCLYIHRGLKQLVSEEDRGYFEELLPDLRNRCLLDPAALFAQLCQLAVGPLVTDSLLSEDELSAACSADFELYRNNQEDWLCKAG